MVLYPEGRLSGIFHVLLNVAYSLHHDGVRARGPVNVTDGVDSRVQR